MGRTCGMYGIEEEILQYFGRVTEGKRLVTRG